MHTHYDAQVTWSEPNFAVFGERCDDGPDGNCGIGFAPVHPDHHDMLISLMEGVEDIPEVVMKEGLP